MTDDYSEDIGTNLAVAMQKGGDKDALFTEIYRLYKRRVANFFLRRGLSSEEARDSTQEVFFRVYRGIESFRGEARFETWLLEIARHTYQNELRRRKTAKREASTISLDEIEPIASFDPSPFEPPSPPEALNAVLKQERAEALKRAIEDLPKQMRFCFILRYAQGRKYSEIAVLMNLGIETVKAHLHQARQKLRLALADDDGPTISRNLAPELGTPSTAVFLAQPAHLSLPDLVERFLMAKHAGSPHTHSAYRRHLQGFVRELRGEELTEAALVKYHASLLRDGRSSTSHQQALAAVRGFLNWLAETHVQPLVPSPQIVRRLLKVPPTEEKPIAAVVEEVEANALLQHAPTARDRAMVGVLLEAGLRVNELVRLEIEDFQNQGLLLHVRARKGGENRILPLTPGTADLVASYLHETGRTWESSGPVFLPLPLRGGRASLTGRLTTRAVEYRLRQILTAAGVTDKKISPNSLRQTYAVRYLQETGDLKTLQGLLGHASVGTTERYLRYIDSKKD